MTADAGQLDAVVTTSGSRSAAIEQLFSEHNHQLVCFLQARLGCRQEAKDVAQEAYVRLLELERPNTISFLRAYLFKIAANLAIDHIRSRGAKRRVNVLDFFIDNEHSDLVEQEALAAEQAARFWQSLGELPRHYRQAVVLNRIQDLSTLEIAASMRKTDRTVRRYIADALTYCRLRLLGQTPAQASAGTFRDA